MPTGKEMCEYIVKTFPGIGKTPEDLWNESQDGTLFYIYEQYAAARMANGLPAFEDPEMQAMFDSFLRYKEEQ